MSIDLQIKQIVNSKIFRLFAFDIFKLSFLLGSKNSNKFNGMHFSCEKKTLQRVHSRERNSQDCAFCALTKMITQIKDVKNKKQCRIFKN